MSYSIKLRIHQPNIAIGFFSIVESTVWSYANGGTWSNADGDQTLTMGGSGTSGTLRFMSDMGERLIVAIGVHNYKRWCDIATGLAPNATGVVVNGEYYNSGKRAYMREKQLAEYSVTSPAGTKVAIKYTVAEGNCLEADVTIE
ncbi:lectin [Paxillus ammoniavirescens]|nr:lectin [Paxillus ammoniavirescens]